MNLNRRYLVFSSVGDASVHKDFWLKEAEKRDFDLVLYYYGDIPLRYKNDADLYCQRKACKWPNFSHFKWKHANAVARYDAIFVVDDDIQMDTQALNEMFDLFMRYELWLAQPAFSEDSFMYWPVIERRQPGSLVRYTNFVECGVMIFSQYALQKCEAAIFDTISGVGLDYICPHLLGMPKNKIAVIDHVVCKHPHRIGGSEMDKTIMRELQGVEGMALMKKYQVKMFPQCSYGIEK